MAESAAYKSKKPYFIKATELYLWYYPIVKKLIGG
jgi:hypothetical protein